MLKKMMFSFSICLLIPTCIAVYVLLFMQIKNEGFVFEDLLGFSGNTIENEAAFSPDDDDVVGEEEEETNEQEEESSTEEELEEEKPVLKSFKGRRIEMKHEQTDNGIHVVFIERDEHGQVIDRWEKTINHEALVEPNSERYLEILAEEFVRYHFDHNKLDSYYAGELVRNNGEFARVDVIKTDWKENFYKEKYHVVIELSGGKPKPVSMQLVSNM